MQIIRSVPSILAPIKFANGAVVGIKWGGQSGDRMKLKSVTEEKPFDLKCVYVVGWPVVEFRLRGGHPA
jgi:hypothetical protein